MEVLPLDQTCKIMPNINFKDISLLTQKATIAGTEKIPVSDTEYITPAQIVAGIEAEIGDIETLLASI